VETPREVSWDRERQAMDTRSTARDPAAVTAIAQRAGLILLGLCLSLLLVEGSLRLLGLPRLHAPHSFPPQFSILEVTEHGVLYVNSLSSRIEFVYDSNPRGYFGKRNEVVHETNSQGFRGPEFSETKPPGTYRILFLGDSFTFGEGVHFDDVYPEVTARLLRKRFSAEHARIEGYDLGVGGYDTMNELALLRSAAPRYRPDAVVLGYVLNDAESHLYVKDIVTGRAVQNPPALPVLVQSLSRLPPNPLYRLRIAQLIWRVWTGTRINRMTLQYYDSLYSPANPAWEDNRQALISLLRLCRERDIPCYAVCFPLLYRLNSYPFLEVHRIVRGVVEKEGGVFIDLLDYLRDQKDSDLWVHPSDQHPNEKVHLIASRALADRLAKDPRIVRGIERAGAAR